MEGFSYNNIFETKGIEYLAIIAFFVLLIPFWILLNRQAKNKRQLQSRWEVLPQICCKYLKVCILADIIHGLTLNGREWQKLDSMIC